MRGVCEFMIWNHILFVYEVIRSLYYYEYVYATIGGITTILSTMRHLHHEQKYNNIEPILAKLIMMYNFSMAVYYFEYYQIIHNILFKIIMILIWTVEEYNYEKIHPWIHILAAADGHIYLNYYSMLK